MLAGQPQDSDEWGEVNTLLSRICADTQTLVKPRKNVRLPRRGTHTTLTAGISYGGGQQVCIVLAFNATAAVSTLNADQCVSNFAHSPSDSKLVEMLLMHPAVRRVANFGSSECLDLTGLH